MFGEWTPFVYMGLIGINLGMAGPSQWRLVARAFRHGAFGRDTFIDIAHCHQRHGGGTRLFGAAIDMGIGFNTLASGAVVFICRRLACLFGASR